MRFSLPSIKCLAGPPSLRLLPNSVRCLNCAQRFDYRALSSSRKLGGTGEHLIVGNEKRISRLSFEFLSPHVIESRSNFIKSLCLEIGDIGFPLPVVDGIEVTNAEIVSGQVKYCETCSKCYQ